MVSTNSNIFTTPRWLSNHTCKGVWICLKGNVTSYLISAIDDIIKCQKVKTN